MTGARWTVRRGAAALAVVAGFAFAAAAAGAAPARSAPARPAAAAPAPAPASASADATSPEARLIAIYRLVHGGHTREALDQAERLVHDVPNFQLAQLLYADLLVARQGPRPPREDVPAEAREQHAQLRREALQRLAALREPPPPGAAPREFLQLPPSTRHAIAVDASRSRLYLFENTRQGLRLVEDHYVSVGRHGVGKAQQGDQRTPLGVYFITSRLDPKQLQDFYGAGALPLNYPNEHDRREGRTGHGIWLHGVPSRHFARTPQSTDGCVVLANPDMRALLGTVEPRRTPVVIGAALQWVTPAQNAPRRAAAAELVEQWRQARSSGDAARLLAFYSPRFASGTADAADWAERVRRELRAARGRPAELKDLSILSWQDRGDLLVVTFGLVLKGERTGPVRRQYWAREGGQWKIFFEGAIG